MNAPTREGASTDKKANTYQEGLQKHELFARSGAPKGDNRESRETPKYNALKTNDKATDYTKATK